MSVVKTTKTVFLNQQFYFHVVAGGNPAEASSGGAWRAEDEAECVSLPGGGR